MLDSIFQEIRKLRATKQNRKLTQKEMCDLVADFTVPRMTHSEARSFAKQIRQTSRLKCNRERIASKADRRSAQLDNASLHTSFHQQTWLDSVWDADSLWNVADSFPTVNDDSAFVVSMGNFLYQAVVTPTSLTSATNAIESVVTNAMVYDSAQAEWLVEAAGLATYSVNYWSSNLEVWLEEYCPGYEGGIEEEQFPTTGSCDGSSPMVASAMVRKVEIPWEDFARVGGADLGGPWELQEM